MSTYSHTYWAGKGKHPVTNKKLSNLVPMPGSVPFPEKNLALEKYRVAANCYYDLYNNGLGNRASEFRSIFGFPGKKEAREMSAEFVQRVEDKIDAYIYAAAVEQGLVPALP